MAELKIAVLTLCRDRLEYSQHCFAKLRELAGCDYAHYVYDQASTDGTDRWLLNGVYDGLIIGHQNVGINRGLNSLLALTQRKDYDVLVKFDNDCELTQENTLRDVAALALEGDAILSPVIQGLNNPPPVKGMFSISDEPIWDIPQIGGIFQAVPAHVYYKLGFRYNESRLLDDDVELCWWWRDRGGRCGYVERLEANHYETTSGQHARYPEYFARTLAEGKPHL